MAASAAAIAITKKTMTSPLIFPIALANAIKTKFTELSINSTDIKITTAFLRSKTPRTPIANIIPASVKKYVNGIPDMIVFKVFPLYILGLV